MREVVVPLAAIRRPLERSRDESKVAWLMEAIAAEGQKEPIDVLELTTIRARLRRANREVLRMHLM